jgi:hypothetical protein
MHQGEGVEHAGRVRVGERGADLRPVLVLDRLVVTAGHDVENSGQEAALAAEVAVHGRLRDPGGLRDRVHRGRRVAAGHEQLVRCGNDRCPSGADLCLAPRVVVGPLDRLTHIGDSTTLS